MSEKWVNHEVEIDCAFEGPEKLLRVCFNGRGSMLRIERSRWESMLKLVRCKILSIVSTPEMEAYVLSESSMFVYPHQVVLKTCGTTTLLEGLTELLKIATSRELSPHAVSYSRRAWIFPDRQPQTHQTWGNEVSRLREFWPEGRWSQFGTKLEDRWYYFYYGDYFPAGLELMMTGLEPENAKQFYLSSDWPLESSVRSLDSCDDILADPDDEDPGHHLGNLMTRRVGIDALYPSTQQIVDSFAFDPCGYSANGVLNAKHYFTIHVTPEQNFSYASFETSVPEDQLSTVKRVLNTFNPTEFTLVGCGTMMEEITRIEKWSCVAEAKFEVGRSIMVYMKFNLSST